MKRTAKRAVLLIGTLVLAASVLTGCFSADQTTEMKLINQTRSAYRKAQVKAHTAAMAKAQAWSDHMASRQVLEHTGGGDKINPSGLKGWCRYGENVGYGTTLQGVHDAFVRSSQHLKNMIGDFNAVGVGVTKRGRIYWVTEIYLKTC